MLGERGRVVVHVLIGPDGHALQARIAASSGFQRLDAAALNAVTAWRYRPAMRGLAPEARWYVVPVRFEP